MSKKIIITISLVSLLLLVVGLYVYWYPVQKSMAEQAIEEYMEKQGISKENIASKQIIKDYKQGGYIMIVKLKDDPAMKYEYTWSKSRETILLVYKGNSGLDTGMKYPPID